VTYIAAMRLADEIARRFLVQSIFANIPFLELPQSKTGLGGSPWVTGIFDGLSP